MRAMPLDEPGRPLRLAEVAEPEAAPGQLKLRVEARLRAGAIEGAAVVVPPS